MTKRLDETVIKSLLDLISDHDELVGTGYNWVGKYEVTTITVRRRASAPGVLAREETDEWEEGLL